MITRRDFVQQSLAVVSLGLAVPSVFSKAVAAAAEESSVRSVSGKTLIVVQMAGGVDGLNTVIPYRDLNYRRYRNELAITESDMIPVNDRAAFHPSFSRMKEILDAGKLAVIEGVGYQNPNFSHFKAMDIWQFADPEGKVNEGWLGRYFEGLTDAEGHPLTGLSYGNRLPEAFQSDKVSIPAVASLESFQLQNAVGDPNPDLRRTSLMKLYDVYRPANTRFAALLDTTLDNAYRSSIQLSEAHSNYKPAVTYPQSSLATGMRLLAELIDSGGQPGASPLRVGHVFIGGFDTHTNQPNTLTRLLRETSEAIHAFWTDVNAHGHGDDVLIMTWSEFGRRAGENAQAGTDHGWAVPMFVVGNQVKGGFYGEPPSLSSLDNGNLRFTTDFRSVYATILERWLKAPADDVLNGRFSQLNFLDA
ncbi:MAG TPA: DUF1501 domain-containing protein [Dehalococcoidia bacterium]|nr:DUF1501 domain-containing protein [Dehalococcoidia bacterium]